MKAVLKFGTGVVIPEGAVYLSTQVEKTVNYYPSHKNDYFPKADRTEEKNTLVWHYFLVDVWEENGLLKMGTKQNPQILETSK